MMVDVVVADAAGGRDAQVVYYCCPRRRREDASWRGECIERHQQFVCLSRVRQRMYIFLEDFTNTTRVNPRSSKFFSEAVSYGAIRCDCQNGCDRCGRSDKQIVLWIANTKSSTMQSSQCQITKRIQHHVELKSSELHYYLQIQ